MQALFTHRALTDSEKRLLILTNGRLITLRVTLQNGNNSGIDEDFVLNCGYSSTHAYNIMMHRITRHGLSDRQQYVQGFILSRATGLLVSSYAHACERRFIDHAEVRDANQKAQMSMTDRSERQLIDTSVSKYKSSNQSSSSNVNNVTLIRTQVKEVINQITPLIRRHLLNH